MTSLIKRIDEQKPLYIFDLDGTLALIEHRRHFVEGEKKDWPAFFAACGEDAPNESVVALMRDLAPIADIWIWSGRSDEVRARTVWWLCTKTHMTFSQAGSSLTMRKAGDHQSDETLKAAWLEAMKPADRKRLVVIFDDRDRVVSMWRNSGVTCLQVAPGNF